MASSWLVLYGATEAMPVCMIEGREILNETEQATARGGGVCLGRPLPGVELKIVAIGDEPVGQWREDLNLKAGAVGEIVVRGPVVAGEYIDDPEQTRRVRIEAPDGSFFHRMGDLGYLDEAGRVWFCGRKSQRVILGEDVLLTISCERVFSAHPAVRRAALVGVARDGRIEPVVCIELEPQAARIDKDALRLELLEMGGRCGHARLIRTILFHPAFPVDRRHSSKIGREALAAWAARRLG